MPRLELYLLGPPRVELDGEPVHIGRRKALALLAYLAVTGQSHSRDSLAALLWPEYDQSSARADLRRSLSLLNRTLGKGWLVADRETAGIDPDADVWLDVHEFRQRLTACAAHGHPPARACPHCVPLLEEAVELYRNGFLSGFTLRDSVAFDEWQFFQTERLRDQLASVIERLVGWHTEQEDYERAIAHARRWLEHDTLNEAVHRELMELYARAGQQTAALRQYQLCEQILTEELGLLPSPETTALYERIRAGEEIGREREVFPSIPHNLPPQPTPFVGREAELAELDELLASPKTRLVTIVGTGGVGKTRLALAVAEEQLRATITTNGEEEPRFPSGVFFVSLAQLSSADQIVPSAAAALNYQLEGRERESLTPKQRLRQPRTAKQQLLDYLREKRMLLIFDNYEHLLDGVDLVASVLQTAPDVQVVATSHERLLLREEQAYPILGLDFPDWERPDDAAEYSALQLFLQSARRIQPSFKLGGDDLTCLARICRLLEGLPLGIELAAGWVDTLSLADIAAEIQRDLDFLETPWRDVPARHRSMRAVFDTSWRRLSEAERAVFARLSVFRGGFTRTAAREVARADLRTLARLVGKSFLQFNRARERYDIHELLRQYGAKRLAEDSDEEAAGRECHSAFFCAALARWESDLHGTRELEALDEIEADFENVRLAWERAAIQANPVLLDQAMGGLCGFLERRARRQEGETLCRLACDGLAGASKPLPAAGQRVLAKALLFRSLYNLRLGKRDVATPLLQQSQALLESPALAGLDTRAERAFLHEVLGQFTRPDWDTSRRHCEEAIALYREMGNQPSAAWALLDLAWANACSREYSKARQLNEESLALFRALGNHAGSLQALLFLGHLARRAGDYDEEQRRIEEGLSLARAKTDRLGIAGCLYGKGAVALCQGRFQAGARYMRESASIRREGGDLPGLVLALGNLSAGHWFSGEFDRAYAVMDESLAIAVALATPGFLGFATAYHAWLDAITGRYDVARTYAKQAITLCQRSHDDYALAVSRWVLSWVALADGEYSDAIGPLRESIRTLQKADAVERQELTASALVALGRADFGLGNHAEAKRHLIEALEIVVEIRAFIPLLHLMPIIPVVLADEEDAGLKERAVELYALATSHPFIANSRLFEDIAGRYIKAATASLPPDVVRAAQGRGQALDWWETAAELSTELRQLGWAG